MRHLLSLCVETAEPVHPRNCALQQESVSAQSCSTLCSPWTVACQAPLSMGFSMQECWSRLPFPPPGDLSNPGIEPTSLNVSCMDRRFLNHWHHLGSPCQLRGKCEDEKRSNWMESTPSLFSSLRSHGFPVAYASTRQEFPDPSIVVPRSPGFQIPPQKLWQKSAQNSF